ncbi:hypothetical protein PWT90_06206 [Aphanocladium album]|nr:hypothetical protein PWT90_06206 [Aphanocladium album]
MVNRGRSQGCVTCKQRRVKCDERRPECGHCRRLGLRCGGYDAKCKAKRLRFKDQNYKFASQSPERHAAPMTALVRAPGPRRLAEPDTAVPFFLLHYAAKGRETASARGFYETLIPAYNASCADSALSLAVSATAKMVLSLWQHGLLGLARPQTAYTEAVGRVLKALQNERERREPATLMAVVALQLYDNIAAVYNRRPATGVHQSGAVSLLPYLATDEGSTAGKGIRRFVFHTEIASAIREKQPPNEMLIAGSTHGGNHSSVLDAIGAEVALLQASYAQLKKRDGDFFDWEVISASQIQEARRIEGQLLAWEATVPEHWKPLRLTRREMDPSVPAYRDACDIYTTCQVASIWNLWRVQRLILAAIIADSQNQPLNLDVQGEETGTLAVQELVDGICYSYFNTWLGFASNHERSHEPHHGAGAFPDTQPSEPIAVALF